MPPGVTWWVTWSLESARLWTPLWLCGGGRAVLPGGSDFDRSLVVKGGVQASPVVFNDPALDVTAGGGAIGPEAHADLRLEGREERLSRSSVETRARPARALPQLQAP